MFCQQTWNTRNVILILKPRKGENIFQDIAGAQAWIGSETNYSFSVKTIFINAYEYLKSDKIYDLCGFWDSFVTKSVKWQHELLAKP